MGGVLAKIEGMLDDGAWTPDIITALHEHRNDAEVEAAVSLAFHSASPFEQLHYLRYRQADAAAPFDGNTIEALHPASLVRKLEVLPLSRLDPDDPGLTESDIVRLIARLAGAPVRILMLDGQDISPGTIKAVCMSALPKTLEILALTGTPIELETAKILSRTRFLALRQLIVTEPAEPARAILGAAFSESLRVHRHETSLKANPSRTRIKAPPKSMKVPPIGLFCIAEGNERAIAPFIRFDAGALKRVAKATPADVFMDTLENGGPEQRLTALYALRHKRELARHRLQSVFDLAQSSDEGIVVVRGVSREGGAYRERFSLRDSARATAARHSEPQDIPLLLDWLTKDEVLRGKAMADPVWFPTSRALLRLAPDNPLTCEAILSLAGRVTEDYPNSPHEVELLGALTDKASCRFCAEALSAVLDTPRVAELALRALARRRDPQCVEGIVDMVDKWISAPQRPSGARALLSNAARTLNATLDLRRARALLIPLLAQSRLPEDDAMHKDAQRARKLLNG